jgi:succinate dehydrogenase / fumarate reductase iron-sulfur subunit
MKISRYDPALDKTPHYQTYTVDVSPNDRILDCLNKIRWSQDGSLAYRMSCGHGICGSDGMVINGRASLACQKLVKDYDYGKEIVVEPLKYFRVVKDLVVDMAPFFEDFRSIHPVDTDIIADTTLEKERIQTIEERAKFDDAIKCIMCACCTASCPVDLKEDPQYIGPAAVLKAQRYIADSRVKDVLKRMAIMEKPHNIWSCKTYYMCTAVCPKKIMVTKAILDTKDGIRRELHGESTEQKKN